MEAKGARARVASGLAVLAALIAGAVPAQAQEPATDGGATPLPQDATALVNQALDRAAAQIDRAVALRNLAHAEPAPPEPQSAQPAPAPSEPPPVRVSRPAAAPDRDPAPAPAPRLETPVPGPTSPDPPAATPPEPGIGANPQARVEAEGRAREIHRRRGTPPVDRRRETSPDLRRAKDRLRAVEDGIGTVSRELTAGHRPAGRALGKLRTHVERLQATLTRLEREAAPGKGPLAGGTPLAARVARVRASAGALAAALRRHGGGGPEERSLLEQLLALSAGRAAEVSVGAPGRRPHPRGAARRPSAPADVAYTQPQAPPARSQTGFAPRTQRAQARPAHHAAPLNHPPGAPRGPTGVAAAGASSAIFSVAGPAVLALLLGLAIPRVLRRLARLPACRPPEWVASPPERPG